MKQKQDETKTELLASQAEALRQEQASLEEETNLHQILKDAISPQQNSQQAEGAFGEQLDPRQVVEVIGEAVGKAIDASQKLTLSKVGELIKGVSDQNAGTQTALIKLMGTLSVNEARKNNTDFDEYADGIKDILSKTQGLSPEDAFLLAKARKASLVPEKKQVESERPGSIVSREDIPDTSQQHREPVDSKDRPYNPRLEFAEGVSAAIDKVIAARSG